MRVFAAHDGGSGCAYYRMIMPLTELAMHGHSVRFARSGGEDVNLRAAHATTSDIVVAERWDVPGALGMWRRMRAHSRLVFEIDDDVFHIEPHNRGAYETYQQEDVRDATVHYLEVADMVTTTCEPLAKVLGEYNGNVRVMPNHIPGWVFDLPAPEGDRPAIGWMGGASHAADIPLIAGPLRRFLERFPGWDSVLIGTDYRPEVKHVRCGHIPWTHITDDPEAFYRTIDFDIGLAPIRDTVFNRSKSFVKALEYAARGIPVIASDVAPYREFVLHGVTGFLVKYEHDWLRYMSELASDEGLRLSMGAKAKEHARQYMIDDGWRLWEQAYEELLR